MKKGEANDDAAFPRDAHQAVARVDESACKHRKMRNLAAFDPGTTSYESSLIDASKLACITATRRTLRPVRA
jgi:hypothetical protein